jgi:CRP-like cAMP-binding protein
MGAPINTAAFVRSRLAAFPLFFVLTEQELDLLASALRSVSFRKGARVFEEGAPGDCCYVLVEGRAKVVLNSANGGEVLVNDVVPGNLVGELALIDGFPRSAALVAVEPSHFFAIPKAVFDTLRKNPRFQQELLAYVARWVRERTDHVRRVTTAPSKMRIAWCLVQIAAREGRREGKITVIPRKQHQEVADMVGCTRETVSRELARLKRSMHVSWDRHTMRVDVDALRRAVRSELLAMDAREQQQRSR